jgi:TetR/AcrR family transcriptional repressor of nem operon
MGAMRYPADHKQRTSERIVRAAAALFRKRGYTATGIDAVMAAADLTAGAFYAHFRSKENLLAEALGAAFRESRSHWPERPKGLRGRPWVREFASLYLSKGHRDTPDRGCPMPALAPEIARMGGKSRGEFERHLRGLVDTVGKQVNSASPDRHRAISAIALCIGGLMLSRAVKDQAFSHEILNACRDAVVEATPRS